ncbi:membrane protein [Flexivirga endophytica]|uniref:Membrane protein n=1 Tax=Flexivirga endophytica TaxID=1849103 RepID=A0A916TC76_9MICO|nr:DMT family transporter [Flexivirga endophytica]GGB39694.1 membrane protein [Flexivirga endophytica]GHB47616.1 membrane protein [Flexivirga endophytica]
MKLSLRLSTVVVVLYALGYPVGALAVQAMSPGLVLLVRFAVSAPILLLLAARRGVPWPRGAQLGHVAVVGLLIQAVQFIGCYEALSLGMSPVLVALIISMNPVVTAALSRPMLGEQLDRRRVLALVLAVAAVLVAFAGRLGSAGSVGVGVVGVLIAVLGLSLGGVYQQRYVRGVDPIMSAGVGILASVPAAIVFAATRPMQVDRPAQAVWSMAAMIIFSSLLGMTFYLAALRRGGAGQVAMLFAVIPSVSAVLSWVLVGDRPDAGVLGGLVLGAAACVLGRARGATRPVTHAPERPCPGRLESVR